MDDHLISGEVGNAKWDAVTRATKEAFEWTDLESVAFDHCGVQWKQDLSTGTVMFSQEKYTDDNLEIELSTDRRKEKDNEGTEKEKKMLAGAGGCLQWIMTKSDPIHAVELNLLQSECKNAKVDILDNYFVKKW